MTSLADAEAVDVVVEDSEGLLTNAARRAATETALPLVATYFVAGTAWELGSVPTVTSGVTEDDDLARFVRMRVALAAAARLEPTVRRILAAPSFFYGREADEAMGALTGPLDIGRYVRTRLRYEVPRRFPIQVIRRRFAIPENAAACYAASWVAAELSRAPLRLIPQRSLEAVDVLNRRTRFAQLIRQPVLLEAMDRAVQVRRSGELAKLLAEVRDRLDRGRIASREPYRELLAWFDAFDPDRAIAAPGAMEWAFYDERFDTKLFELWALQLLADALSAALGPPLKPMAPLYRRNEGPLIEWHFGPSRVRVTYQASLAQLSTDGKVRWHYKVGAEGDLRGFPDVALEIEDLAGTKEIVLVDPKLRQRTSLPAEEVYKLLGYFQNLTVQQAPVGAIIYYSPGVMRRYKLASDGGGVVYAVGVDPLLLDASRVELDQVASLILERTGISEHLVARLRSAADADAEEQEEIFTAIRQSAVVDALLQAASQLPAPSLAPMRKSLETQLGEAWSEMSPDTQTMLVTAEYFGMTAPAGADHSGPVLGLAAACERLLYERLLTGVIADSPGVLEPEATLGAVIRWLSDACRTHPRTLEGEVIQRALHSGRYGDLASARQLTGDLRRLNVGFRIPAAHRDVVSEDLWRESHVLVIDTANGLLVRLLSALTPTVH